MKKIRVLFAKRQRKKSSNLCPNILQHSHK